jgi:uncharacterized surface protein with fasciclin (FAS1) repeats
MRASRTSQAGMPATLVGAVIAGALALTAAACSSTPSTTPAASPSHHSLATHHPMTESAQFGADCGMIPATGMGSLHGMSMDPVATAASHNPLLTTLAADIKTAGLTADLNSMHPITVFAPANAAFASLPASDMTMLHSTAELTKILKYHIVNGHVTTAELAAGSPLTTLEGSTLRPSKMGSVYEIDNADVICGNIQTANATVYIINKVLVPMH